MEPRRSRGDSVSSSARSVVEALRSLGEDAVEKHLDSMFTAIAESKPGPADARDLLDVAAADAAAARERLDEYDPVAGSEHCPACWALWCEAVALSRRTRRRGIEHEDELSALWTQRVRRRRHRVVASRTRISPRARLLDDLFLFQCSRYGGRIVGDVIAVGGVPIALHRQARRVQADLAGADHQL